MVYWSPHSPSNSKVAGSNPGIGGPFSIFFPQKQDKRWRNWWQWKPGRNKIVELEIINFSNFGGRFLVIQWNFDQWNMKHLLDWPYNVRMEFSISVHCACSITAWKKVKTKGAGSDYLCYNFFFFSNQNFSNSNVPQRPRMDLNKTSE